MTLHSILKSKVAEWGKSNYTSDYPVISEIFNYNQNPETQNLSYLRKAQFEALETYWYLRLVEKTPHIFDLYKKYFQNEDWSLPSVLNFPAPYSLLPHPERVTLALSSARIS